MSTNYLVFDTETGGTNAEVQSLLTAGFVAVRDNKIVDTLEVRVPGPFVTEPEAMAINRIDIVKHEALATETTSQVARKVLSFINDNMIQYNKFYESVGWRVGFDIRFLWFGLFRKAAKETHKNTEKAYSVFDSLFRHPYDLRMESLRLGNTLGFKGSRSEDTFNFFGVNPPTELRHTALGDAIATAELLIKYNTIFANPSIKAAIKTAHAAV